MFGFDFEISEKVGETIYSPAKSTPVLPVNLHRSPFGTGIYFGVRVVFAVSQTAYGVLPPGLECTQKEGKEDVVRRGASDVS
jgi:hypothetical protein